MPMQNAVEASDLPGPGALRRLLKDASVEVTTGGGSQLDELKAYFPRGIDVHVAYLPTDHYRETVATASALRAAGYNPVPHIAVRALESEKSLDEFLARSAGEAGVVKALVIAGDLPRSRGPFSESLDVLKTGLFQKHRIGSIAIAGHPEGHPVVATDVMDGALAAKIEFAEQNEFDLSIITQFCFEASPILHYVRRLRTSGIGAPVRIGVAGPAGIMTLMRFGMRCGVGNSLRALRAKGDMLGRLATDARPDDILREIAGAFDRPEFGAVEGVHFYVFGGLRKAGQWLRAALDT
jgi:methylenetetrahydrofolate reductase (NADPH)